MHTKLLVLCLVYCVLALLWVFSTDLLLQRLLKNAFDIHTLQVIGSCTSVLFTALLLYVVGRCHASRMEHQRKARSLQEIYLRNAAAIFESTLEGVIVTDAERHITHINPALGHITGYAESEVLGRTPSLFSSGLHNSDFYQDMWHALSERRFWSGEIWNRRKSGELYAQWQTIRAVYDDNDRLTHYIGVFSDVTLLKRSREDLAYLTHYDQLLDLPNRLLFLELAKQQLERSLTMDSKAGGALLLIDLDHFKNINESLGHNTGDALLKEFAARLHRCQSNGMVLARLDGDELALLVEQCSAERAAALAQRILADLNQVFILQEQELFISASIGIAFYPYDAQNIEQLLRNADSALFKAKANGRSTYAFYSQELTSQACERVQLATSLRQALEQQQLVPYYQPIHDLKSGEIVGFEALARWQHPEQGLISPARFIPVAEETGLIAAIDRRILEQACRQTQAWLNEGRNLCFISVNISSRLFHRGELDIQVAKILARTGLPAHRLILEITESAVMEDAEGAMIQLDRLRKLGVSLAIDDFGTGYSSLQRLKRMNVHKLKLDQGFVKGLPHDAGNVAITRSVITLAHNLGLRVVAEGIELPEQAAFLLEHHCDLGQGYGFGRPQPAVNIVWQSTASMQYGQSAMAARPAVDRLPKRSAQVHTQ
ncbi:EAL domain-containing protein [Azomonas macrocytogenes]|uniref:EAL domain-containing protein n=1 Tax=Azomonas macrocytogenes TaxID=69962 RepID=UPI001606706C